MKLFVYKQAKLHHIVYIHKSALLFDDIIINKNCSIWPNVVIRADFNKVRIGEYSHIQDNSVIHVSPNFDVSVGDYVIIGHSCVLHGCRIGNRALIGMNSTILDGVHIDDDSIIGANSLLTQNMYVPKNSLVTSSPGVVRSHKIKRKVFY